MDKLTCIKTFIETVNCGSLKHTAVKLNQSEASISKRLSRLERDLGTKLLLRDRSGIQLTEVGQQYYDRCRDGVNTLEQADKMVLSQLLEPHGEIKVVCNSFFAKRCITPKLSAFQQLYPRLQVNLDIRELSPYFDQHDMDILFGVGVPLEYDSNLVQKRLRSTEEVLCASPGYIEKFTINKPADLMQMRYIAHSHRKPLNKIYLDNHIDVFTVPFMLCDNASVATELALQGIGYVFCKKYWVEDYLKNGTLVQILSGHTKRIINVYAYYQQKNFPDPGIRAFMNHFTA